MDASNSRLRTSTDAAAGSGFGARGRLAPVARRPTNSEPKLACKILQFPRTSSLANDALVAEEARLVAEAREGSTESFAQLVRQNKRKIYRLALRITGNEEDAADVLQEAFMKAYANLKTFHGDSRFYTWLARIAVNEALTKLRKRLSYKHVYLDDDTLIYEITDIGR